MSDPILRLRLARTRGIGPRGARAIEARAGGLEALFASSEAELIALGIPVKIAAAILDRSGVALAAAELDQLRDLGAHLRVLDGPGYPARLASIHDPPQVLSLLGELSEEDAQPVAIVGARRATLEGREIAYRLGADLAAAGVTVVSGLARGIDRAAHVGALEAGGRTLAILGSGLRRIYPPQNRGLAERISRAGALVSELAPDARPGKHTFPQRNRIVAGISLGVVVVQAGPRSGALITADFALQEGRELFAVPGSTRDPLAQGTNALLKDGAHLVATAQDVLDVLFGVEPADDRTVKGPRSELNSLPNGKLFSGVNGTP